MVTVTEQEGVVGSLKRTPVVMVYYFLPCR